MSESTRASVLREAEKITTGDRNVQYGDPTADFKRIAALWNAEFGELLAEGKSFEGHHVAIAQVLLKLSRLAWSPDKRDSWVDVAGYAACGAECALPPKGVIVSPVVMTPAKLAELKEKWEASPQGYCHWCQIGLEQDFLLGLVDRTYERFCTHACREKFMHSIASEDEAVDTAEVESVAEESVAEAEQG